MPSAGTIVHGRPSGFLQWLGVRRWAPVNVLWLSLLIAATSVWGFGTMSPYYPRWLVIYVMASVAGIAFIVHLWKRRALRIGAADLAVFAFVAYAAQSILWSADWREGLYEIQNLAALAVVFLYVRHANPKWVPEAALFCIVLTLVLVWLFPADNGGHGNPNFTTEFLLIAAPLACGIRGRPCLFIPPVFLAVAVYLFFFNTSNIEFAVLIGLGAILYGWALVRASGRWAVAMHMGVALAGGAGVLLLGTIPSVVSSLNGRLELFTNTIVMWWDKPFFGHGLGSFNYVYPLFREFHLTLFPGMGTILRTPTMYAGHAHNELLQGLAELGIVGMVLAGLFLWIVFARRRDQETPLSAIWVLVIAAMVAMIEFPLSNPATAILVAVALGQVAQREEEWVRVPNPATLGLSVLTVLAGVVLIGSGGAAVAAERHIASMRVYWDADPLHSLRANMRAREIYPLPSYTRHHLVLTLANLMARRPVAIAANAADHIYAISKTASANNPASLIARVEYLMAAGRYKEPEVEMLLAQLKRRATLMPATWLNETVYANMIGDKERASRAMAMGMKWANPVFGQQMAAILKAVSEKETTS